MYVKAYTIVPLEQVIDDGIVTVGVMVLPQASFTTGAVGSVASARQLTVEAPLAGSVKSGAEIV